MEVGRTQDADEVHVLLFASFSLPFRFSDSAHLSLSLSHVTHWTNSGSSKLTPANEKLL